MPKTSKTTATRVQNALHTNDTKQLQAANLTLDSATQSLAAVVIEKAMKSANGGCQLDVG